MNAAAHKAATCLLAAKHCRPAGQQKSAAKRAGSRRLCSTVSASPGPSDKDRKSQELQAKARLLRRQQEKLARQLAELDKESQELSDQDQKLVKAELTGQDTAASPNQDLPDPIKKLLNSAGVLDAVPWDGPATGTEPVDTYFAAPEGRQDYDLDYDASDLDEIFEGPEPPPDLQGLVYPDPDDVSDDEEGFPEDNEHFEPGEGVEEMLKMLEEGGTLPDIEGLIAAEDPKEFQQRVQKLVDRYEDRFRKKKDQKLSTEEVRKMEEEEAWESTDHVPIIDEDITEVRPTPALPEPIQQQYDTLQHCCYLLRRAHLSGKPDEPVKALASAGLVDMKKVQFDDPMICSIGIQPWLKYMEALKVAGAWTQAEHVWAEVSDDRPNPEYTVYVDQFVNLPYPKWYYRFLTDNADHYGARLRSGLIDEIEMDAIMAVHESCPKDPSIPVQSFDPPPPTKKFWFENIGPNAIFNTNEAGENDHNERYARFAASEANFDPDGAVILSDQEIYRRLAMATHDPDTDNASVLGAADSAQTEATANASAAAEKGPADASQGDPRGSARLRVAVRIAAAETRSKAKPSETVNRAGEVVTKPKSNMLGRLRGLQHHAVYDKKIQKTMRDVVKNKRYTGSSLYLGTEHGLVPRVLLADDIPKKAEEDAQEAREQEVKAAQDAKNAPSSSEEEGWFVGSNEERGPGLRMRAAQRRKRYSLKSKIMVGAAARQTARADDKPTSGASTEQPAQAGDQAMSGASAKQTAQAIDKATATPYDSKPLPGIDLLAQFASTHQSSTDNKEMSSVSAKQTAQAADKVVSGASAEQTAQAGDKDVQTPGDKSPLPGIDLLAQFGTSKQSSADNSADTAASSEAQATSSKDTVPELPNIDLLAQFGSPQQQSSQVSADFKQTQASSSTEDDDEYGPAFLPSLDLLSQFGDAQQQSGQGSPDTIAPTQPQASNSTEDDDDYGPAFLPSLDLLSQFGGSQSDAAANPSAAIETTNAKPEDGDSQDSAPAVGLLSGLDQLAQFGSRQSTTQDALTSKPDAELKASTGSGMNEETQMSTEDAATSAPNAEPKASPKSGTNAGSRKSKSESSAKPQAGASTNEHGKSEYDSERNRYEQMKLKGFANDKFYGAPTVNLDGAQVLTPDGWQRVTPGSKPGKAWEKGNCMTLSISTVYELNAVSGKIVRVTSGWSTVNARAWTLQNVVDLWIQCAKLGDL